MKKIGTTVRFLRWMFGSIVASVVFIASANENGLLAAYESGDVINAEYAAKGFVKGMMGEVLPPGISPSALPELGSEGATLLERYCMQCHELPSPGLHTSNEWPSVVDRMRKRMGRLAQNNTVAIRIRVPTTLELDIITAYLAQFGFMPIDIAEYVDLDTPAGNAFQRICSYCHALPDPKLHNADEWRDVVLRMRENMIHLNIPDPGDDDIAKTINFLQAHARD